MCRTIISAAAGCAVFATLISTLDPAAAAGATIDCGKASTKVELAICSDSELSALEAQVTADYNRRYALTAMDLRKVLIRSQLDWYDNLDRKCGQFDSIETGMGQCILGAMRERAATLENDIATFETAISSQVAAGQVPGGEPCIRGTAWRLVSADDHVCVGPTIRQQVVADNAAAAQRVEPGGDKCLKGFVWREAVRSDHVCVDSVTRSRTAADNVSASERVISTSDDALADLCAAVDAIKIGKELGIAGTPELQTTAKHDCHISFDRDVAEVELDVVPRLRFGMPVPGREVTEIPGLGDKAIFDETTGSDGISSQTLFVLKGNTGLVIELMRHHVRGPNWHVALAGELLAKLQAHAAQ